MQNTKKIKGTVVVEFEMTTDKLTIEEMANYMKSQLKSALKDEWQVSRCEPNMSTFKYNQDKPLFNN